MRDQHEARSRLHPPFHLLSDPSLTLNQALGLLTATVGGREVYRRVTMVIENGRIVNDFYPIEVPEHNPAEVLTWLDAQAAKRPHAARR